MSSETVGLFTNTFCYTSKHWQNDSPLPDAFLPGVQILTASMDRAFSVPSANILYMLTTQSVVRGPAE